MMKKLFFWFGLLFFQNIFGQDTYFKGYIILEKGDTIDGYISNVYDCKNINFKKFKTASAQLFKPSQLRGFTLDGNVFESRVVHIPTYKKELIREVTQVVLDREKGYRRDTIFLHKLIEGDVSFYTFKTLEGQDYYFGEKAGVLHEIPPKYLVYERDTTMRYDNLRYMNASDFISTRFFTYEYNTFLDTLVFLTGDKTLYQRSKVKNTPKQIHYIIAQHNLDKNVPRGGVLKEKLSRKIFWGAQIGTILLTYDKLLNEARLNSAVALNGYGLLPLIGFNRYAAFKFSVNYYKYNDGTNQREIISGAAGLRYSQLSGKVRPYFEGNICLAFQNINRRKPTFETPLILDVGVNIPVRDYYINLGISHTPIMLYKLNGYRFWSAHLGFMF